MFLSRSHAVRLQRRLQKGCKRNEHLTLKISRTCHEYIKLEGRGGVVNDKSVWWYQTTRVEANTGGRGAPLSFGSQISQNDNFQMSVTLRVFNIFSIGLIFRQGLIEISPNPLSDIEKYLKLVKLWSSEFR